MGRYINRSDVEAVYGAENVAAWSNLDNAQAAADERRIEAAVDWAEAAIDDAFRGGPYRLPLRGPDGRTPPAAAHWSARLAGAWLRESRAAGPGGLDAETLAELAEAVQREIRPYLAGQRRLDARPAGGPGAPVAV